MSKQQQIQTVQLTKKQMDQYKQLDKFLENKNYKKGLKAAQKLLKQVPEHGQTYSMKAIFIHYLDRQDQALVEAKQAVNISKFKSRRCWQNYGFLLRLKRDYQMALLAYNQAKAQKFPDTGNKNDALNSDMTIMREVTNLQAQARDYNGLCQTRFEILKQKTNAVNNWLGLAMAYYLKGDYQQALRTLESTTKLLYTNDDLKPPHKNNFNIYYCMVYRESGNNQEFYKQLKTRQVNILDKVVYKQLLIEACLRLNKTEQAEVLINELITTFPQNTDYFDILKSIRKADSTSDLQKLYQELSSKYKSRMASLLELSYIRDQKVFKTKFSDFIYPAFKKNIVSIFSEINLLYNNPEAHKWIGDVLLEYETSLRKDEYPNGQKAICPVEFLWALYFRSQHLALQFNTLPDALTLINQALVHTPTLVQLYMVKADILQKLHQPLQAALTINQARQIDLADRYMNNICIKYQLRAGKPELAEATMKSFMGTESTPYDLQNMWFEIEMARCFLHKGEYAPGLRHLNFIQKQFEDMYEDQYDFHSYSLYRWALKEYVDLIRKSDDIYNDRRYMQASAMAVKYIMEYAVIKDELAAPKEYKDVTEGLDYGGVEYLKKLTDPYQQAFKWAKNTISARYVNKNNQDLNLIYFKAFGQSLKLLIHLNKPMLALKAFRKLLKTNSSPQVMHLYKIKAFLYFQKVLTEEINPMTKQLIKTSLTGWLDGASDAKSYHQKVVSTWDKSPESKLREQQANLILTQAKREQYIHLYQRLLKDDSLPLKDALRLIHKLEFYRVVDEDFRAKMNERFGKQTGYFGDWQKVMDETKKEEWCEWWNERYKHLREKEDKEQEQAEKKKLEEAKQKQAETSGDEQKK